MNQLKTIMLLAALTIGLGGCELEHSLQYGDQCNDVAYIIIATDTGNDRCEKGSCPEYDAHMAANGCPIEYPHCINMTGQPPFCANTCVSGTHKTDVFFDTYNCKEDTIHVCGMYMDNCSELDGWKDGSCTDGECVATKCQLGYKLVRNECRPYSDCCGWGCARCASPISATNPDNEQTYICSGMSPDAECLSACTEQQVVCMGICIDPATDPMFCGADADCTQFNTCTENEYCIDGQCTKKTCDDEQCTEDNPDNN